MDIRIHCPVPPAEPADTPLYQNDTQYLLQIPGMRESIIAGMNTPTEECDDEVEW